MSEFCFPISDWIVEWMLGEDRMQTKVFTDTYFAILIQMLTFLPSLLASVCVSSIHTVSLLDNLGFYLVKLFGEWWFGNEYPPKRLPWNTSFRPGVVFNKKGTHAASFWHCQPCTYTCQAFSYLFLVSVEILHCTVTSRQETRNWFASVLYL